MVLGATTMAGVPILLLDEDPLLRGLLTEILTTDGHPVRAYDSVEALHRAGREGAALAIVEAWGDSHGTLSEAERREIQTVARAVPTLMVTARPWARTVVPADLGLLGLVTKPFDLDELCELIKELVAGLTRDSAQARAEARELRGRIADSQRSLRRASRRLDEVGLLVAEGRIVEALATGAALAGAPAQLAARFGLEADELDRCLANLGAADWVRVQRGARGRLVIRLNLPAGAG
jgi:DNA-binding response OmpR family regulator